MSAVLFSRKFSATLQMLILSFEDSLVLLCYISLPETAKAAYVPLTQKVFPDVDNRVRDFALEAFQQITVDLLKAGEVGKFLTYLDLPDRTLRETFLTVMMKSAKVNFDLQKALLEAGFLGKIVQYVAGAEIPSDILSATKVLLPDFALQICASGSTSVLFELALHPSPTVSSGALAALRRILHGDKQCHHAVESAIHPHLNPVPSQLVDFALEALPILARNMISDDRHDELLPGYVLDNPTLRVPVVAVIIESSRTSPAQRNKLVKSGIIALLSTSLAQYDPPRDLVQAASVLFLLIAPHVTQTTLITQWIDLLEYPASRQLAVDSLMKLARSGPRGQQSLVEADILTKVLTYDQDQKAAELIDTIETLICELLPLLGVACCRNGQAELLLHSATTTNVRIRSSAMVGIKNIVGSSLPDRTKMRDVLLLRLGSNEYVTDVASLALPVFARDLITEGDLDTVVELVTDAESRVRQAVYLPLKETVRDSSDSRRDLVGLGFFEVVIRFCSSPFNDRVTFGCEILPMLAVEACRIGSLSSLLGLFSSTKLSVRQALYSALLNIARGNHSDQKNLVDSEALDLLVTALDSSSQAEVELCETLFPIITPSVGRSERASTIILGLLPHKNVVVAACAVRLLDTILDGPLTDRRGLRQAVVRQLHAAPPPKVLQYCAKALSSVLCDDYTAEGAFTVLFELLGYAELEVRTTVSSSLRTSLRNVGLCEQLGRNGLFQVVLDLLPEGLRDILLFAAEAVLPALGPYLVDGRDTCTRLIALLGSNQTGISEGATSGLQRAAEVSTGHRRKLVEAGLFTRLLAALNNNDVRGTGWIGVFLPLLTIELAQAGICEDVLDLLNNDIAAVRAAATQALKIVLQSQHVRAQLVSPLLARSGRLTDQDSAFFAEALVELSDAIMRKGEEKKLILLMWHDIPLVSEAAFSTIRTLALHGSPFDQRKLLEAGLAGQLHQLLHIEPLRTPAIPLSLAVLPVLADRLLEIHKIDELYQFLSDPEPSIPAAVDATIRRLSANPSMHAQLVQEGMITRLFILYDQRPDELVQNLICHLLKTIALPLIDLGKTDILVGALRRNEFMLRNSALIALQTEASKDAESVKSSIILSRDLLPNFLHILSVDSGNTNTMKDVCVTMEKLAAGNAARCRLIIESGIVSEMVELCRTPDSNVQLSALKAVYALSAVPIGDKSAIIESGVILVLIDFLKEPSDPRVTELSLKITDVFAADPQQRAAIGKPDILDALVQYMIPREGTQAASRANQLAALQICLNVASGSDSERRAVLDGGLLPPLLHLIESSQTDVVVFACGTIQALGQTGTFRQHLLNAEADKRLKRRTSLMHKSTLAPGQDKKSAKKAAKDALDVLDTGMLRGLSRKFSRHSSAQGAHS